MNNFDIYFYENHVKRGNSNGIGFNADFFLNLVKSNDLNGICNYLNSLADGFTLNITYKYNGIKTVSLKKLDYNWWYLRGNSKDFCPNSAHNTLNKLVANYLSCFVLSNIVRVSSMQ